MFPSSRRDQGPPVKVRVIVTKFVEVEAREFKSAVQYLTGKDSVVAEAEEEENRGLVCRFGATRAAECGPSSGGRGKKRPLEFASGYDAQVLQREEEEEDAGLILLDELFEFLRE